MNISNLPIHTRKKKLTDNNRKWFDEYIEMLRLENKKQKSIDAYSNIIINLLELEIEKDINTVDIETFAKYIYETDKGTRVDFKIGRISSFLKLVEKYVILRVKPSEIEALKLNRKDIENSKRNAEPLNVKEVVMIRNIIKNDLNKLFTFEMVYQLGVTLDELTESIEENFDNSTGIFTYSSRTVKVTDKIIKLISQKKKLLASKTRGAYFRYIKEIGDKIGRKLIWSDIIETRRKYFFMCSLCERQFENTPQNWALIHYENDIDGEKWIVCKECAEKGEKS